MRCFFSSWILLWVRDWRVLENDAVVVAIVARERTWDGIGQLMKK